MTFTPVQSLVGGLTLSYATSSLLLGWGRTLGVSGVAHSVVSDPLCSELSSTKAAPQSTWKQACLSGFLSGGLLLRVLQERIAVVTGGAVFDQPIEGGLGRTLLAGLLVGVGTKIGLGCTSGHMLGGFARFTKRSIVATVTFFGVALAVAQTFPANLPTSPRSFTPTLRLSTILALQVPALLYTIAPFLLPSPISNTISSFLIGLHFSFGLSLAGMTRPSKVLSFFYFPLEFLPLYGKRAWDPSLAMVAIGGLIPTMIAWRTVRKRSTPFYNSQWELSTKQDVDLRLVGGSALFGVGWGLSGLCPGPALAVLGSMRSDLVPFMAAFVAGGAIGGTV